MSNPSQTRHATDTGKTRDKIDYPDPAAAPLGTDDEAAGAPRPQTNARGPEKGDRIADGDPSVGEQYLARGEEDNRAPADAPPNWRTWTLIAGGLVLLGVVLALAGVL